MPNARQGMRKQSKSKKPQPGRTQMSSGLSFSVRHLGQRVRLYREGQGLLQKELAKRATLPIRTIGRIERGEVDVRLSTLDRIAKALRMPLRRLLS
jgi:ribosome-binding protein aMBF1 (putative translation factor)